MSIEVTTEKKREIEKEIQEELKIDDANVPAELKEHATHFFYYGQCWARALKAERHQRLFIDALEASLAKEFREMMLRDEPGTRITEKMLKEFVSNHPKFVEESQKLIQLEFVADIFNTARMAFESRGRMLLELSKVTNESKFYDNEYSAMRKEFELREEKKAQKKAKKEVVDAV
jgi:hypothetical protein